MVLSKTEIRWMLRMVEEDRDSSKRLMDVPGQQYAALHKLNYENMSSLAEKLEQILDRDVKRVTIR